MPAAKSHVTLSERRLNKYVEERTPSGTPVPDLFGASWILAWSYRRSRESPVPRSAWGSSRHGDQ